MKINRLLIRHILFSILNIFIFGSFLANDPKPTMYIIGDSTVRNGNGNGGSGKWGWGSFMHLMVDTTRMVVRNNALGGTSTRTYLYNDRWQSIVDKLKKGDVVLIQFGHNDGGMLADTARARGTKKGVGEETEEVFNPILKKQQVVHTYGWYLRKYVREAKERGAIPYLCSPVPRNIWVDGKIKRSFKDTHAAWTRQVAMEEKVCFIDLNTLVTDKYDEVGEAKVAQYFVDEPTHTGEAGAKLNASIVAGELRKEGVCSLKQFIRQ
jgi:rhamnogalacturonan acetylesterase